MKVWTMTKNGSAESAGSTAAGNPTLRVVEVTDTGWISGSDVAFLEEMRRLFEEPLDDTGAFPLPGMRGYPEKRVEQLTHQGFKVLETHEV
jgi:hypothetical protein